MIKITTYSASETKLLGIRLAELLSPGKLLILTGDLGAGKTTFTQGLAQGIGITKTVTSPTFTIMKVYKGPLPLYHIDAYRLEGLSQDLGLEEMMEDDGICVIEWPKYISAGLPERYLNIDIKRVSEDVRLLTFIAHGAEYETILKELQ
ncbi:MAG: tRNA (adenosine(37)-N6)-threonylcarbamoyltransferase complex ATPase subunit type 1 TsaE [Erysipelotrichaceae bacterium]|nr:tRNA (adenosine(37)-N6)-threonylcarbamoyltransferase complex ATPase subunit type 1 TsaE [Erysipelotrichaceae bacterium]